MIFPREVEGGVLGNHSPVNHCHFEMGHFVKLRFGLRCVLNAQTGCSARSSTNASPDERRIPNRSWFRNEVARDPLGKTNG